MWRSLSLPRFVAGLACAVAMCSAAAQGQTAGNSTAWTEVVPGVLRSAGMPCSYALVEGHAALLIDAAEGADRAALLARGIDKIELVLATHHHRDSLAQVDEFIAAGATVRAPLASATWITPEGVRAYWQTAMPAPAPAGHEPPLRERTFNEWVYLVLPRGIPQIECNLADGEQISWRSWRITCLETPGHSRDHMAFAASRHGQSGGLIVFCGDALSATGKMPTPYTTDWDHWTGRGLQAAFQSLRKLAALDPALLCPEHGPPIHDRPAIALYETAMNAAEAAFLKSYERFTKERLGSPPAPAFLAKQQVVTAGDEPWTALTPHLYLTGNTFALASRKGPMMLLDAYGPRINEQIQKLRDDKQLGPVEVVTISHAHNDHYKGIYLLPHRDTFGVWAQARVSEPLLQPYRYCAPYLDARPLAIDRALADEERVTWHEYELTFHHLPGQTDFSMGLQATIDGKKCFFTGDSFYHADQFSGSGGWSGRNRGLPLPYAASAQKILDAAPDWILCEHGGAFTFDADDFSRRVQWAKAAAAAADALSPGGEHRRDWDPQYLRVEPLLLAARPGQTVAFNLVQDMPCDKADTWEVACSGHRQVVAPQQETVKAVAGQSLRHELRLDIEPNAPPGRYVMPLVVRRGDIADDSDIFCVIDVAD
ncbi:MAG: MBL fold metallo-hydrolase [Pirellulales bacterium]